MKIKNLYDLSIINYIRFFKKTELYQPTYNPYKFFIYNSSSEKRKSDDRVALIKSNLPSSQGSYLDIGSQLGYFVFKMSELNYFSVGIESNPISFLYSSSLARLNKINLASFFNFTIDLRTVSLLPEFDVISILSVYHHLVFFFGKESADSILKILISKCRKTFFFETGEYSEKGFYWTDGLSFMGENDERSVIQLLESFHFKSVKKIGEHSTHLNNHKRSLFVCNK